MSSWMGLLHGVTQWLLVVDGGDMASDFGYGAEDEKIALKDLWVL